MTEQIRDPAPGPEKPRTGGIGFGLFLLISGLALLAQNTGWFPKGIDWFFPAILIVWGASEIYQRSR